MAAAYGNLGIESGRTIFTNNKSVGTDQGLWLADNIDGSTLISGNEFFNGAWSQSIIIIDAVYNVNEFKLSDGEISGNKFHTTDAWGVITITNDRKGTFGIIDNKNPVLVLTKDNMFDIRGNTWTGK
jgi:hypothetical protein